MKPGIAMLVIGLVLGALGVFLWDFTTSMQGWVQSQGILQDVAFIQAIGKGLIVLGGGLGIGGIVRMVIRR